MQHSWQMRAVQVSITIAFLLVSDNLDLATSKMSHTARVEPCCDWLAL